MENKTPNRLENEKSLYLRQHIYNLVYWYPWGEEAFELAAAENKPVFLSIGYSSCHWCHVMALECFENQKIADYLNEFFISVKVDREERPDIDRIYMSACQAVTGAGGWPLSVFINHDKKPFYAGTYFPPWVFLQILKNINRLWQKNRESLMTNSEIIIEKIKPTVFNLEKISYTVVEEGYLRLKYYFDREYGGFSREPKFPLPHYIWFLLKHYQCYRKEEALFMARKTLDEMRMGGIYDHVGFGFYRYSTDRQWTVPHFEKMLSDNALLMYVYTEAYRATRNKKYRKTVYEIARYLSSRLKSDAGGFYSAEDADSEGEEGKHYIFSYVDITAALGDKADLFSRYFAVTPKGNFNGQNVLRLKKEISSEDKEIIDQCLNLLRRRRAEKVPPLVDNKILVSLNGLAIAAFAYAGKVFGDDGFIKTAEDAARFIDENMIINGKLHARYCEGEVKYPAYADDYASLLFGLIELYQATFSERYLEKAILLNNFFYERFYDIINGGYYFTDCESETVLFRDKEFYDGAAPSANALQVYNLYRLFALTGDIKLYETSEQTLGFFIGEIKKHPLDSLFSLLSVSMRYFGSVDLKIIVPPDFNRAEILAAVNDLDWPFVNTKVETAENARLEIHVCMKGKCYPPITEFRHLPELIKRD